MKHTIKITSLNDKLSGVTVHEFFNSLKTSYDTQELAICKIKFISLTSSLITDDLQLRVDNHIKINNLSFVIKQIIIDVARDYTQTEKIYYLQLIAR